VGNRNGGAARALCGSSEAALDTPTLVEDPKRKGVTGDIGTDSGAPGGKPAFADFKAAGLRDPLPEVDLCS